MTTAGPWRRRAGLGPLALLALLAGGCVGIRQELVTPLPGPPPTAAATAPPRSGGAQGDPAPAGSAGRPRSPGGDQGPVATGPGAGHTELLPFTPPPPSGEPLQGACELPSLVLRRPGVFRCLTKNAVHDPCFALPDRPDEVVCTGPPPSGEPSLRLQLMARLSPLPDLATAEPGAAWAVRLRDGTVCVAASGLMPPVLGLRPSFDCGDDAWLLGLPRPGEPWRATWVQLAADGRSLRAEAEVDIAAVWR